MLSRELVRVTSTIAVARLIGPDQYGVAAQAMVYSGLAAILVDPAVAAALIQRRNMDPRLPGAMASVNLIVGILLAALTVAIAPLWAGFMRTPQLEHLLWVLGPSLLLRSLCVAPRALLTRALQFRTLAIVDAASALLGAAAGVTVALITPTFWAIVAQMVTMDLAMLLLLIALRAGVSPNLHFGQLRPVVPFMWRAFASGLLFGTVSQNIDNLLVGRFQGPQALALYGIAYRLLITPVALANGTLGSVLLPTVARMADNLDALRTALGRLIRVTAALVIPLMATASAAAPDLVSVVFGPKWAAAAPIVAVMAIAGGLQAVQRPFTGTILMGLGRSRLLLRYTLIYTVALTLGIVAGLAHGPLGVAIGFTAATVSVIPLELITRRLTIGVGVRTQIGWLVPGLHVAVWTAAAYLVVAEVIHSPSATLGIGVPLAALTGLTVLRIAHRPTFTDVRTMLSRLANRPAAQGSEES